MARFLIKTVTLAGAVLLALGLLCAADVLRGEEVVKTWSASPRGAQPSAVKITGPEIEIDLEALAAGTKVHAARLVVDRDTIDGTMDEAWQPIEILTGPDGSGKRVDLLPPWYNAFDVTAAVRSALTGTPRKLRLRAKCIPKWQPDKTRLEVTYDGPAEPGLPQVKGVKISHRAGQTFITWTELDLRVPNDKVTWGELQRLLDEADQASRIRYRVYRHGAPITSATIAQAEFLAEVQPLSGYNVRGRSVDQLMTIVRRRAIDDLELAKKLARDGYFAKYNPDMPELAEVAINRFAIDDAKPLPVGTGLYVHHPPRAEKAYYAVAVTVDGVANLSQWTAENASQTPLEESPGTGEPVLQGRPDVVVFFDYPGTRLQYVQWAAPPLAHLPNQYYNWGVFVPASYQTAPVKRLSLFFHDRLQRFLRPAWPHRSDTVLLSPHDAPYRSYGYGYHESLGTLRSFQDGNVEPFFGRRVDAFLAWAMRKHGADPGRVSCGGRGDWGGTAALQYGLKRAGRIAYVMADGAPDPDPAKMPYEYSFYGRGDKSTSHRAEMDAVWGKPSWRIPAASGQCIWDETALPAYARAQGKQTVLPYLSLGAGSLHPTWPQETDLMKAYRETRNAFMGEFWWGGTPCLPLPVSADMGDRPFEPRSDRPLLAVASQDYGPSPQFITEQFETGRRGYASGGRLNTKHRWDPEDIVDTAERLELTIFSANVVYAGNDTCEVTVRNARVFKPAAGERIAWSLEGDPKNNRKSGEVVVSDEGFIILPAVLFSVPARLVLTRVAK
jgi:hypothetical protein